MLSEICHIKKRIFSMISLINSRKCKQRWISDQALPRGEARRKTGVFRAAQRNSGLEDVLNCSVGFTGATICQNLHNCTLQISVPYINFISVSLPIWGGGAEGEGREEDREGGICFFQKGPESRFLYFFSRKTE